jgi:hypothetical protein
MARVRGRICSAMPYSARRGVRGFVDCFRTSLSFCRVGSRWETESTDIVSGRAGSQWPAEGDVVRIKAEEGR